jgi:predicted phosphoribosyltransferase
MASNVTAIGRGTVAIAARMASEIYEALDRVTLDNALMPSAEEGEAHAQ